MRTKNKFGRLTSDNNRKPKINKMSTKKLNSGLETKIAIEALKGMSTIEELCEKYKVSSHMICSWRTHLLLSVQSALNDEDVSGVDAGRADLYRKIGRLYMENEMLRTVLGK